METVIRKGHKTDTEQTQNGHSSDTIEIWNKPDRTNNIDRIDIKQK